MGTFQAVDYFLVGTGKKLPVIAEDGGFPETVPAVMRMENSAMPASGKTSHPVDAALIYKPSAGLIRLWRILQSRLQQLPNPRQNRLFLFKVFRHHVSEGIDAGNSGIGS